MPSGFPFFCRFVKTLLLWDIDGTLLASGGAGMRSLRIALQDEFGIDGSLDDIDWSGRTDKYILRQIFAKFGIEATPRNFERYLDRYVSILPGEMARTTHVLPGVKELLVAAAARGDVAQGLLTGNIRRGAQTKLTHHQLWDHFAFGAFADDSELRNDLGPFALERAKAHHGVTFHPDQVWIIGDTPHDVACGKIIGARTLAVATGHHPLDELQAHTPTAAMANLSDHTAFWRLIGT